MPLEASSAPVIVIISAALWLLSSFGFWTATEDVRAVHEAMKNVVNGTVFYSGALLPLNAFGGIGGAFFSIMFESYYSKVPLQPHRMCLKFFMQPILAFVGTPVVIRYAPFEIPADEISVVFISFCIGVSGVWIVKFLSDHLPTMVSRAWFAFWKTKLDEIDREPRE